MTKPREEVVKMPHIAEMRAAVHAAFQRLRYESSCSSSSLRSRMDTHREYANRRVSEAEAAYQEASRMYESAVNDEMAKA